MASPVLGSGTQGCNSAEASARRGHHQRTTRIRPEGAFAQGALPTDNLLKTHSSLSYRVPPVQRGFLFVLSSRALLARERRCDQCSDSRPSA